MLSLRPIRSIPARSPRDRIAFEILGSLREEIERMETP
jgi:hypothetical protein